MATDHQRIAVLRRHGFTNEAIAAILDSDVPTVSGGDLPAAGGGDGLVVGHFELIDYSASAPGTFPVDPTILDFDASPVPWEFWMNFNRTAPGVNGFSIMEPVGGEIFDVDNRDFADSATGRLRTIIPPDTAVQLFPSGDTSTVSIDFLMRRALG